MEHGVIHAVLDYLFNQFRSTKPKHLHEYKCIIDMFELTG